MRGIICLTALAFKKKHSGGFHIHYDEMLCYAAAGHMCGGSDGTPEAAGTVTGSGDSYAVTGGHI